MLFDPKKVAAGCFAQFYFHNLHNLVILEVDEVTPTSIIGFDLMSGKNAVIHINSEGALFGEHGQPARNASLITGPEACMVVRARADTLRAEAKKMRQQYLTLELQLENYEKRAKAIVAKFSKTSMAA